MTDADLLRIRSAILESMMEMVKPVVLCLPFLTALKVDSQPQVVVTC